MSKDIYLIWSYEHGAWWSPYRAGYTRNPARAGNYSFEEATEICEEANRYSKTPQERMVLLLDVDEFIATYKKPVD